MITPCLWFDGQAEEAARFYAAIFPDSRIERVSRAPADNPGTAAGEVLLVFFTLRGQQFVGVNGGPQFPFTEAVSFQVDCADRAEVDRYWEALIEGGGEHGQCGWLKDRFGLSWQVIPSRMGDYVGGPDPPGRRPGDGGHAPDAEARHRRPSRRLRGRKGLTATSGSDTRRYPDGRWRHGAVDLRRAVDRSLDRRRFERLQPAPPVGSDRGWRTGPRTGPHGPGPPAVRTMPAGSGRPRRHRG
jgi:predicted 3-demethylubiquinone-9 3-methyltransferase (glyoxalase superfamily)